MSARRIVVDTNIVVSALTAGGTPQRIIQAWVTGEFLVLMSKELQREINTVLSRSKLVSLDRKRRILLGTLFNQALMVMPVPISQLVFSDENDHFLYELAMTGQASCIITGDKALLRLKRVSGIEILSPDQFCKRYRIK